MSINTKDIKSKIRKLLDLAANDAAVEGEINNAVKFADQLLARHNLTREDITPNKTTGEWDVSKVEYFRDYSYALFARYTTWENWLGPIIAAIVTSVGCYRAGEGTVRKDGYVRSDEEGEPLVRPRLAWYGPAEDVRLAIELFDELQFVVATSARLRYGGIAKGDGAAYAEGFVTGFGRANWRERQLARHSGAFDQTTALMLIDSDARARAIREGGHEWLGRQGVHLRPGKGTRGSQSGSREARDQGRKDGEKYKAGSKKTLRLA